MTNENAIRDHQTWINYLLPDGLVVSAAALVDAQVYLDRDVIDRQRTFDQFVQDVDLGERDVSGIHDLQRLLVGFLEWPEDLVFGANKRPVPDSLTVGLPELNETLAPTFALADVDPHRTGPAWLLLVKEVPFGTDLDARETGRDSTWSASATQKAERLLRETDVPIALLSNGTHLRLVYAPRGENSGSLTFPVQAMTEVPGRPILSAFWGLLSRGRLLSGPAEARLPGLLVKSREYQATVSKELAGQVLDALYELVRGLQAADAHTGGELLKEVLAEHPDEVYRALLTVLLRLVFTLYAEDRALLPTSELYAANYSVHGLFARLRADAQKYPDTMDRRYGAWAQLVALFRAVHGGSKHEQLKMPPRKGFLFDPERFPFLEGRRGSESARLPLIADGVIFRVLEKLLLLGGERLSYRTLDVEQIGSVYETMMGFRLEMTSGRTIALKAGKSGDAPVSIDLDTLLKLKPAERVKYLAENADLKLTGKAADGVEDASSLDQLLSALDRRIARNATPDVLPAGNMVLQPTDERRRSGSHYTPRSLTEPVVRTTLRPILERLGSNPKPDQILDLKVCDIAVGSGAFLVETCRQLGDALLKAWHAHGAMPHIPPDEDDVLHARRVVAQRCLYGVDKNPLAVDLTKLSLWLATLAKDHPFTFLDHAIRAGDSLVGLTAKQIADFHWLPEKKRVFGQEFLEQRTATATSQRQLLLTLEDDLTGPELKLQKLRAADEALNLVREAGDLVIAAFFAGDSAKERLRKREEYLSQYTRFYREFDVALSPEPVVDALRHGDKPVTPFHWEIEFPEVFASQGKGFDAIVGNPPFLRGRDITGAFGPSYLAFLHASTPDAGGQADLVAYFFRRAFSLARRSGTLGLIATNTISQGDTRAAGLSCICKEGGRIFFAKKRLSWPGAAAVSVSVVCICRGDPGCPPVLNGRIVPRISAFLFHAGVDTDPTRLGSNTGISFKGIETGCMAFVFDDERKGASPLSEMNAILQAEPAAREAVVPFLTGDEILKDPRHAHTSLVIDFGERDEASAGIAGLLLTHLRRRLQEALGLAELTGHWWWFRRRRPEFRRAIASLRHYLAHPYVSTFPSFVFVPAHTLLSAPHCGFASESGSLFAILQCRVHETHTRFFGPTLEERPVYTPSDCFETFPLPTGWGDNPLLEAVGKDYYEFRAALMIRNNEGLTKTYNRFHDSSETDLEILRLRERHDAMDRAVLDAYGWTDISPTCEFLLEYDSDDDEDPSSHRKKPWRYRWPDEFRDEVLARLLALNAQRAGEERLAGEARAGSSKKPAAKTPKKKSGASPGGVLFDS